MITDDISQDDNRHAVGHRSASNGTSLGMPWDITLVLLDIVCLSPGHRCYSMGYRCFNAEYRREFPCFSTGRISSFHKRHRSLQHYLNSIYSAVHKYGITLQFSFLFNFFFFLISLFLLKCILGYSFRYALPECIAIDSGRAYRKLYPRIHLSRKSDMRKKKN